MNLAEAGGLNAEAVRGSTLDPRRISTGQGHGHRAIWALARPPRPAQEGTSFSASVQSLPVGERVLGTWDSIGMRGKVLLT